VLQNAIATKMRIETIPSAKPKMFMSSLTADVFKQFNPGVFLDDSIQNVLLEFHR